MSNVDMMERLEYLTREVERLKARESGSMILSYGQIGVDAAGRTRTSQPITLGDYKVLDADYNTLVMNSTLINGGLSTFTGNKISMTTAAANDAVIRQSRRVHSYISGNSIFYEFTFDTFAPDANCTKRLGGFSSNAVTPFASTYDGFYLESVGSSISLNVYRAGTATLNALDITSWSGYNSLGEYRTIANWDNFTVCAVDFLWLGGAVLRLWVKTSTGFVLAHQFNYAGTAQNTFMLTPNQPVRYEIRQTGAGSGEFRFICAKVATEGALFEAGKLRSVDTGATVVPGAGAAGTKYPIIGVRKATAYRDIPVYVHALDIALQSNADQAKWSLEINPTLSGALAFGAVPSSAVEFAVGAGGVTVTASGLQIASGYVIYGQPVNPQLSDNLLGWLSMTIANSQDEFWLCGTNVTAGIDYLGSIDFKEF